MTRFVLITCLVAVAVAVLLIALAPAHHKSGHGGGPGGSSCSDGVIYRNRVGLKPGEFARFRTNVRCNGPVTVRVKDQRINRAKLRTITKEDGVAFRIRKVRAQIAWPEDLFIRVANNSNKGRRVSVAAFR